MAWRSHGRHNDELVNHLKKNGMIVSREVEDAMRATDRGYYCPRHPYMDSPQSIDWGVTISAPHMHASMLEVLKDSLVNGTKALDVGSGSGYLTVCMALMMGEGGRAVGIDHIPELVEQSVENVRRHRPDLLDSGRVKLVVGDGRKGYAGEGPYDAIHVGAAARNVPHQLLEQLKPGGCMVIPVESEGFNQMLEKIEKDKYGKVTRSSLMGVMFVPLTDKESQVPHQHTLPDYFMRRFE